MTLRYYANAPATTLAAGCTNAATSISVASVTGFPTSYPYVLILDRGQATEEVVEVTAGAGTTLTVTRGVDSTTAFSHSSGATVEHGISARDIREPNSHINSTSGVHGATGSIVGTTDTQTLTNKTLGASNTINGFTASRFMEADGTGKLVSGSKTIPTGALVGTSDAQALTNKDLTGAGNTFPTSLVTLTGAQALTNKDLTGAGNTFPTSLVTLTGSQTLTNKTLTSPTINSPTIDTPTITGVGQHLAAAKASDQSVTSSTTLVNDNDMTFVLSAGGTYIFDAGLMYTAASAGDIKLAPAFSGTGTLYLGGLGANNAAFTTGSSGSGEFIARNPQGANSIPYAGSDSAVQLSAKVFGTLIATTSGTLTLQWAQNASSATATVMKTGSWMWVRRVA